MSDSKLAVVDPVAQAVAVQLEELGQWIVYAKDRARAGDGPELINALDTIESYKIELAKHSELTASVVSGLQQTVDALQTDIVKLTEEVSDLEDNLEERAVGMAEAMVESEIDFIFDNVDLEDEQHQRAIARKMVEYSIDEVKDEERQRTEHMLREAESIAMNELTYGGPDDPDVDLEDEAEEA